MTNSSNKVTILTPTFNRANYLPYLYDSLQSQTNKMFEWIIIDDGSDDRTSDVVSNFKSKTFSIRFLKQKNQGKHIAINNAMLEVKTELIIIVDSDDSLTNDAIERICNDWDSCKENLVGISYLRQNRIGNIIGDKFTSDYILSTHLKERIVNNIRGDKAEVWKTEEFIKFPFLEFEGEIFFSEQHKYLQMSGEKKILYVNNPIYICEYLKDGLSHKSRLLQYENPNGTLENAIMLSDSALPFKVRLKALLKIYAYSKISGRRFTSILKSSDYHIYWLLFTPLGVLYLFYISTLYYFQKFFVRSK